MLASAYLYFYVTYMPFIPRTSKWGQTVIDTPPGRYEQYVPGDLELTKILRQLLKEAKIRQECM